MKKTKLTVGLIGCGMFAECQDLPNFTRHPQIELKWCCDTNLARARQMAERFSVPETTNCFNDVINDPVVDMIKISTSHEVHLPIIEAAAAKGIHVFCEKPMALEENEAYKIIQAVKAGKIKLCVDLNRRMASSMWALREKWLNHLKNPTHQPWRFIEMDRAPLPEENQTHMLINVQDESSSYRIPHFNPLKGGGEIIGETVHWLDLACWFFSPQLPVEIQGWGSTRLSHGVNLKFSDGDTAAIIFHCSGTFDYPKEIYEVRSHGALFQNMYFVENRYYGIPGLDQEIFPLQADCMKDEIPEEGFDAYMKKYKLRNHKFTGNGKSAYINMPLYVDKGHYSMLCNFVDAIINDTPSPCDEIAGFRSTYLAQLAIKSIELRQTLPVLIEKITPVYI
jgi:predicted dehydrogenase